MKAPILTDSEINERVGYPGSKYLAREAQVNADHEYYQGVVREIFEQLEGDCPHCPPGYKYKADCLECLSELKSRFLEGEK